MRRPALEQFRSPRRILEAAGAIVLLAVVLLFVATAVPQLVGADHSYVVQTDSMSPAIGAGSVVFVSDVPVGEIAVGDVITFEKDGEGTTRVTHRVVDVLRAGDGLSFRTKGDANEEPDPQPVPAGAVVGVVSLDVPYVGYVLAFGGTGTGILVLVVVPAVVLVVLEVRDLLEPAPTESSDSSATDAESSRSPPKGNPGDEADRMEVTNGGE